MHKQLTILGVPFFNDSLTAAVDLALQGGLVLAPSGPGMADLTTDPYYDEALLNSDINLMDSGLMVLIWNRIATSPAQRISGYLFLQKFLQQEQVRQPKQSFWVMPSQHEMHINLNWLNHQQNFYLTAEDSYLAPMYRDPRAADPALVALIEERKPAYIIINIGGGIQEKLGYYLKTHLSYRPTIICTGAAIAFMTGQQAKIPMWADALYLGWLFRIGDNPKAFVPRYWKSKKLAFMLLKHKHQWPGKTS